MPPPEHRKDIRTRMRRMRRELASQARADAAAAVCTRLTQCEFYQAAQNIAAYFPNDGELDSWPIIHHAWSAGKSVYLPVVLTGGTLSFVALTDKTTLKENRYGIPEPSHDPSDILETALLDLVLVPLVGFDTATLFRLGMGGGYYDRTFSCMRHNANMQSTLIGIGYDFQQFKGLCPEAWDVPARRVITDKAIYKKEQW